MAQYLDQHSDVVESYQFSTTVMDKLLIGEQETEMFDLSDHSKFTVNLYAVDEFYHELTYDEFYIPVEVNGEPGVHALSGEKEEAHHALYAYESPDLPDNRDPHRLINSQDLAWFALKHDPVAPLLMSEGFRKVLSVDTSEHNRLRMQQDN